MAPPETDAPVPAEPARQSIAFIRQMLGELRTVADEKGADMLCYLIEMAYVEAGDLMSGRRKLSVKGQQRDEAAGVALQATGQIKF